MHNLWLLNVCDMGVFSCLKYGNFEYVIWEWEVCLSMRDIRDCV